VSERKISTPLVLAVASGMLAVAAVVWVGSHPDEPDPPERHDPNALHVDDSPPEHAAESYYDAWRRRRWDAALGVSVGAARRAVIEKRERDEALPDDERIIAERMWDALARAPLTLVFDEAEMPADRVVLRGTAEYVFVNRPYRRRVELVVLPHGEGHFRVSEMRLGEVLTELPPMFQGAGDEESP
jgi:hypothetical protein